MHGPFLAFAENQVALAATALVTWKRRSGFFLVFANDAGLPVPSPDKVLSPVTYVLNTGMGITAKTSELCALDPSVADGSNIHEAFANLRDDG